jgi:hypothetical protein
METIPKELNTLRLRNERDSNARHTSAGMPVLFVITFFKRSVSSTFSTVSGCSALHVRFSLRSGSVWYSELRSVSFVPLLLSTLNLLLKKYRSI